MSADTPDGEAITSVSIEIAYATGKPTVRADRSIARLILRRDRRFGESRRARCEGSKLSAIDSDYRNPGVPELLTDDFSHALVHFALLAGERFAARAARCRTLPAG